MKRVYQRAGIGIFLAVAALGAFLLWHEDEPQRSGSGQVEIPKPSVALPVRDEPVAASTPAPASLPSTPPSDSGPPQSKGSPLAADLNAPGGNGQQDVETLHALLRQYLHHMHHRQGLPIGDDIDLARVLTGHNPVKLVILPAGHAALSPDGHLRDRWGTPYFIHPLGHNAFEVRSAGPDRKLFTADDFVKSPVPEREAGE